MEILKIQNNVLKAAEARDLTGIDKYFNAYKYMEDDNYFYVVENAIVVYAIPKRLYYLNTEKVFKDQLPVNLKKMLDDASEAEQLIDTETEKKVGNGTVHIFQTAAGDQIYVDKKLLKYHKLEACTFNGTKRNYPVYIYEEDTLTAVALPVNYK